MADSKHISLQHGSGGKMMHQLIRELFLPYFDNPHLQKETDSAILNFGPSRLAFTTDSFVIDPVFFPGGDIGKLAVCGTVNDLLVSGATPKYISCGWIIEEGFEISKLEILVQSMAKEAKIANVQIVTGDIKVVEKGKCDKVFINTSGIGYVDEKNAHISTGERIKTGDLIIISGGIAEHGMAVYAERNNISSSLLSDCTCLNEIIEPLLKSGGIHFMRDPTRGGLATVLCECCENKSFGIQLFEEDIPVQNEVNELCDLFGFDPLYIANEGKVILLVDENEAQSVLHTMQTANTGKNARIIGEIHAGHPGKVTMKTSIGGSRILNMLTGEQLPRIC